MDLAAWGFFPHVGQLILFNRYSNGNYTDRTDVVMDPATWGFSSSRVANSL